MSTPPTPPEGWPSEPEYKPVQWDRSQPPVVIYQTQPQRQGPSAGTLLAAAACGGGLMLAAAVSAVALAVCAVSIALCAVVIRWVIADIRKGRES